MSTCNPSALLVAGISFTNLSPNQIRTAKLALLRSILLGLDSGADVSVASLIERGKCFLCLPPDQIRTLRLQMLCNVLFNEGGDPAVVCGCVTPTMTSLALASEGAPWLVSMSWTLPEQACPTYQIEIWRSVNGGDFSLWATAQSGDTTYENSGNNPAGSDSQEITFKLRYASNDLEATCNFSNSMSVTLAPS